MKTLKKEFGSNKEKKKKKRRIKWKKKKSRGEGTKTAWRAQLFVKSGSHHTETCDHLCSGARRGSPGELKALEGP